MMDNQDPKVAEQVYQGSLSLIGFFLALFTYSYVKYIEKQDFSSQISVLIPAGMGVLLTVCSICTIVSFLILSNKSKSILKSVYCFVLAVVAVSPLIIFIFG